METKIKELIDDSIKFHSEHILCSGYKDYIDGFLNGFYVLNKITEKEMNELFSKYTDTDYF